MLEWKPLRCNALETRMSWSPGGPRRTSGRVRSKCESRERTYEIQTWCFVSCARLRGSDDPEKRGCPQDRHRRRRPAVLQSRAVVLEQRGEVVLDPRPVGLPFQSSGLDPGPLRSAVTRATGIQLNPSAPHEARAALLFWFAETG